MEIKFDEQTIAIVKEAIEALLKTNKKEIERKFKKRLKSVHAIEQKLPEKSKEGYRSSSQNKYWSTSANFMTYVENRMLHEVIQVLTSVEKIFSADTFLKAQLSTDEYKAKWGSVMDNFVDEALSDESIIDIKGEIYAVAWATAWFGKREKDAGDIQELISREKETAYQIVSAANKVLSEKYETDWYLEYEWRTEKVRREEHDW